MPTGIYPGNQNWSQERRGKISKSKKGHKFNLGRKATPEALINMSICRRGKNRGALNHFWKGGMSDIKHRIRNMAFYSEWRYLIFMRDKFICQECGAKGGWNKKLKKRIIIQADHYPIPFSQIIRQYNIKTIEEADNCELLWNLDNGRTLCLDCHMDTDNWGVNDFNHRLLDKPVISKHNEIG